MSVRQKINWTEYRLIAANIVLLAILLRALVPDGWMPNPDGPFSGTPILICSGHGPLIQMGGKGGDPLGQTRHKGEICSFAAFASPAIPAPACAASQRNSIAIPSRLGARPFPPGRKTRYRRQIQRGPPLHPSKSQFDRLLRPMDGRAA